MMMVMIALVMMIALAWWRRLAAGGVLWQERTLGFEGPVAGDAERTVLVGGGYRAEEQLGAGVELKQVARGNRKGVEESLEVQNGGCSQRPILLARKRSWLDVVGRQSHAHSTYY